MDIDELGLTFRQMNEVQDADPLLVAAWLEVLSDPAIDNPAAWFLTGIRSGVGPSQLADQARQRRIRSGERWIVNAGLFCPTERDILDELFDGQSAILRAYKDEERLRDKMVDLWRLERPTGEQVEREALARAERYRRARTS